MASFQIPPSAPAAARMPILHNGDHWEAAEFLRRYEAMEAEGDNTWAELIDGKVYFMTPVRFESHGEPDSILQMWLGCYAAYPPGVKHAVNTSIKMGARDVPQPDGLLWDTKAQKAQLEGRYLKGAPELVAETTSSSVSYDSREKLETYRRAGVAEYVLWRTEDQALDWWVLQGDRYVRLEPDSADIIRSPYFRGLWLHVPSLLAQNRRAVLATLNTGLADAHWL